MKVFINLLNSLILAGWVGAIAVFSIQNIQNVSLQFLIWRSINLPIGVLLAFCAAGGIVLGSLLPLLWQKTKRPRRRVSGY
jgi:lipopolysaccharide assembly protein A